MKYDGPLDIVNFLDEKNIVGYCNYLTKQMLEINRKFENDGLTVLHKNEDYGFLLVDYGFLISSLMGYAEGLLKATGKKELGVEIASKIERDFLYDEDKKLARNGRFFVDILMYYGLSFINKNNKSFYSRMLLKDKKSGVSTLLNSISINSKALENIIGKNYYDNRISSILETKDVELIAYDRQIKTAIKAIGNDVKVHNYWSRDNGLNKSILS